jgi:PAS domain S-box-containing protein
MSQPTVLVVEDNAITRKMVRTTLTAAGYVVVEAADGHAAVDLAEQSAPDLVLQDLLLPDMDGLELVSRLRSLPAAADIPIIAFSGFVSRAEATRAHGAGFTDFLLKPVEPVRLLQVIGTYLPPGEPPGEKPGRGRHVVVVDDDPVQLKLARAHLTHLGFHVTTATNGRDALARARESPVDAILSDVLMPEVDGFQLCLAVRETPLLARTPVVLCTNNYIEDADRRLGERVGASAMTCRTPDFREAIDTLLDVLERKWAPRPQAPAERLEAERLHRAVRQLERQLGVNVDLLQRASLQGAVLSMLAGLAETLARPLGIDLLPGELLASALNAGGVSLGALYLIGPDGRLRLDADSGQRVGAGGGDPFLGSPQLFQQAMEAGQPVVIPSAAVPPAVGGDILARLKVSSAVLLPLVARGERLGVLLLAANRRDLADLDWLNFAQTMASQIAQAIALGRAFAQLAASEARYRSLFDNVPVGLFRSTSDGRMRDANAALVELLGFPDRDALLAVNATEVWVDPAVRPPALPGGDVIRGLETRLRRRDGTVVWARVNMRLVRDEGHIWYEGSVEDITERKQAEAQLERQRDTLAQTEKLAAMGQLLAGVAHELNNPLSVILGQTALLGMKVESGPVRDRTAKIGQAAERCARIVKNFLALARQHPPERQATRLNEVVREAVELLAYPLRLDNVEVRLDLEDGLPAFWADPHQLQQVVLNLVSNAHQAMRSVPGPRRLTVVTRFDPIAERVHLAVTDTGPGVPPEITPRIFEPFFTTKPAGQGTGLGLSLCRGIVEAHGGSIELETTPGAGAVFRVALPVAAPRSTAAGGRAEAPPVPGKAVLVVDDEPEVAEVLADMLSEDGHRVDIAASGAAAVERLGKAHYDLVLADVRMPEMDGPALYHEIARRYPHLLPRFVFLTGDALSSEIGQFLEDTGAASVSKPFVVDEVRQVVRKALAAAAAG